MTLKTKMAFALLGVALAASACGSTASAAATKTVAAANLSTSSQYCKESVRPPKGDTVDDPNAPTAKACWADGLNVGDGPLAYKQIIFAAKQVDLTAAEITPQDMRKNPTQAEHEIMGVISSYASPEIIQAMISADQAAANKGYSQMISKNASSDPTGIVNADYKVTPIGVKMVPSFPHAVPAGPFNKASVAACANAQIYGVNKAGQRLPGGQGQPGYTAWTDTMQKTASGWIEIGTTAGKAVPSCIS